MLVALDTDDYRLERGDEAPDFELTGTDGADYSLADFGAFDALLVVFTCNHCPYAKAKMDELNYLAETYDDLAVVGINPNDAEEYPDDSFDRMQELVFIGIELDEAMIRTDLDACLLTDEELSRGPSAWQQFENPWGEWLRTSVDEEARNSKKDENMSAAV